MGERRFRDGTLVSIPFGQSEMRRRVRESYRDLRDEFGAENVLVVTGSPTSMDTFRQQLADEVSGSGVPRVSSLVVHATDVVNTITDKTILSDSLRQELVHHYLAEVVWETRYFQRAARLDSFAGDVAQLMGIVTWQDMRLDQTPSLVEVQHAVDGFHDWLTEHDHIERGQILPTAIDCLGDPAHREVIVDFDAVLAVEFEEFYPIDRRYLDILSTDLELVCIREQDSSVRRTSVEPGPIADHAPMAVVSVDESASPDNRPEATAQYLATGRVPTDPGAGGVTVLHSESMVDQADRVADEIERLRIERGWEYDAFAVAVNRGGSAVSRAVTALTQTGIPTASTTVTGFGDDPAVRELLTVIRQFEAIEAGTGNTDNAEQPADRDLLRTIEAEEDSMADSLRRWATTSGLKARIAERESPLDARSQFGNVRRVFSIATFIEETGFISDSWQHLHAAVERAHLSAPTETRTSATDRDGGVRVDHLQALKNGSWRTVFILDVVDQEYPGDPFLTRLFPRERIIAMPDFPGVTTVAQDDVQETFRTTSTSSSRPITQYHIELARRRLAVGANAATDELYFCLYDHADSSLDERVQPSRFLTDAYRQLSWIGAAGDAMWSTGRTAEFVLARIDRALADIRRTQSRDDTVSVDDIAADLAAIQELLHHSGDHGERIRDAVRARVDFAAGRVRRE